MPRYGIASALHGGEVLHWTTSTVIAHSADNIVLGDVWREEVDPRAPDAVRAIVARYVDSVRAAIVQQAGERSIPVVYCTQEGPRVCEVECVLGTDSMSTFVHQSIGAEVHGAQWDFHPRGYQSQAFGCDIPLRRRERTVEYSMRMKRNTYLRSLYWDAEKHRSSDALAELRTYVDVLAERYADRYRQSGWDASTRFFLLGSHVPEHKDDVQYNMIRWFDFRRRFAEKLIEVLDIDHCICVKAPLDAPSPPTSDITATYLGDGLNAHPALAMVASDLTYTGDQLKCS